MDTVCNFGQHPWRVRSCKVKSSRLFTPLIVKLLIGETSSYYCREALKAFYRSGMRDSMENLFRYVIRVFYSHERITCHRETGYMKYKSKDGVQTNINYLLPILNELTD